MAHSLFLQQMAARYTISIDDLHREGKVLVCRRVLEGLEGWLRQDSHEKILPAITTLQGTVQSVRNEFYAMRDQGELEIFWQSKFIKSVGEMIGLIEEAYRCAYAASVAYDNEDNYLASKYINSCYTAIKQTIGGILISHE